MRVRRIAAAVALGLLAVALAVVVRQRLAPAPTPPISARQALLARQGRELARLGAAAEAGQLLDFPGVLIVVDQALVQDLLRAITPFERDVGSGVHVRIESAETAFGDGVALVRLIGTASLAGASVGSRVTVLGTLDVVGIAPASGLLECGVSILGVEAQSDQGLVPGDPVGHLSEALARGGLSLLGPLQIPIALEDRLSIPGVDSKRLHIAAQDLPLHVAVRRVAVFGGRLWVLVDVALTEAPLPPPAAARAVVPAQPQPALLEGGPALAQQRLEKALQREPLVAAALAARGQVVLAIRAGLIEQLAASVARHYLDQVTLDLSEVEGHSSGELRKKTLLGRIKLGDWNVSVEVGGLKGQLRAGVPRVGLRAPALIDVALPVDVQETEGDATLHFGWDSAGLANAVCKDFELTREIRGRVLAQRHELAGALRLDNTGERLTITPVFPERKVPLQLDLTAHSWGIVEAALRSQDTAGTCGRLMDPEKGLEHLRELAARGIRVRLPDSVFRTVKLPARLQESVQVNERSVRLRLRPESLQVDAGTLWSSASVTVADTTR